MELKKGPLKGNLTWVVFSWTVMKKLADILPKNRNFQAYILGADFTLINWIGA